MKGDISTGRWTPRISLLYIVSVVHVRSCCRDSNKAPVTFAVSPKIASRNNRTDLKGRCNGLAGLRIYNSSQSEKRAHRLAALRHRRFRAVWGIRGGLRCLAVELSLQGDRRWTFELARDVKSGD